MTARAAIVLAGGRASRLGGADKASVEVAGRRLVDHVYAAVADCAPVIAVGPDSLARPGVTVVREEPPFGGPVAALAAALKAVAALPDDSPARAAGAETWVLACDLPRAERIIAALEDVPIPDGAEAVVLADVDGRAQWLAGRYRLEALHRAVAALGHVDGAALRQLLAPLTLHIVPDTADASLDLDTWAAVEQYREQQCNTLREES
ncbi:molybdopterin-guanine dinucleotide biosynthesis protein A [Arthrobacter woluwensis]|uniref:molybdenum cofactor guanylyltransferase n=1 Tax=Arthrobacter woluwensis TaxID=156980 RepID=UPI00278902F5|nr:NTP transferase domain-containing protein [Arthrobacter woluwensis]MDQ0708429.1 molybdopterin-guanine dinucleotide biosynthesis protein A [Arthrobacter woluwensis]